jgi:hypothetical protein
MARIVLGSYMVRYSLGGMLSWVLQYLVGLRQLGHEVWFVEKAGYANACFDPERGVMSDDCSAGTATVDGLLRRFGLQRLGASWTGPVATTAPRASRSRPSSPRPTFSWTWAPTAPGPRRRKVPACASSSTASPASASQDGAERRVARLRPLVHDRQEHRPHDLRRAYSGP